MHGDGRAKSMAVKRARHYNETKSLIAIAMIILGICSLVCFVFIWPQDFLVTVFNSRLARQLILDADDHYTCTSSYVDFVIDEPTSDYSMTTFYVFSITNAANVLQRGYKPMVIETGPYGFVKYTYRYDVTFQAGDSKTVAYKEYSYLNEATDPDECEAMFYRMGRNGVSISPCSDGACKCQNLDTSVLVINPLLLKLLWEETPFTLLAHYSHKVYSNVKKLLDVPFSTAVRAHTVSGGLREAYQFRTQFQVGQVLETALNNLLASGFTLTQICTTSIAPSSCGLEIYGINTCPFNPYSSVSVQFQISMPSADRPSFDQIFNGTKSFSIYNYEQGLARWLGVTWYYGYIAFDTTNGYVMVTMDEMKSTAAELASELCWDNYASKNITSSQLEACQLTIKGIANFIGVYWLNPFSVTGTQLQGLVYKEYVNIDSPVVCSPLGVKCLWQFAYVNKYMNANFQMSNSLATTLVDLKTVVSTNPNSLYKDLFAPKWYNSYLYCTQILHAPEPFEMSCTNLASTIYDGTVSKPGFLWATETGFPLSNITYVNVEFGKQPEAIQNKYLNLACNISTFVYGKYPVATGYNDEFTVRYLNKYKDKQFDHNFVVGNWSDLGIAQWAGGFVTSALAKVRSTKQIVRDGMWNFGPIKYYSNFLEFSSWASYQGFPFTWMYSIDDARTLLGALASDDQAGVDFRRHIFYTGSTFIGDGENYVNGVGDVGELTFTPEANRGNYSCGGANEAACKVLNVISSSSPTQCSLVESLYSTCYNQYVFENNRWIDPDQCSVFVTSLSNPSFGIPCNAFDVYGNTHPYNKTRGSVVYQMTYGLTYETELLEGLWCESESNRDFSLGGLFANTTARKVLFNGYTEPSVLYYMDQKYRFSNIQFECFHKPYDICGNKIYSCDDSGVVFILPNQERYHLAYNYTPRDEYFAPHFVVTRSGDMLWPYSQNASLALTSQLKMLQQPEAITIVNNPFWTAYPAWNTNDSMFLKFFQCQKRVLTGRPGKFNSCIQELLTGEDNYEKALSLRLFYGNSTIGPFGNSTYTVNGSIVNSQFPMYLWSGFSTYPYTYSGQTIGANYSDMTEPVIFSKDPALVLKLSQSSLIFIYQRQFQLVIPLSTGPIHEDKSVSVSIPVRRFVEIVDTWKPYRDYGQPKDSYGMPYKIPIGFASLELNAEYPIFVETPHSYGNFLWGGLEYSFVLGTTPNIYSQRNFLDYDPVTGRAIRQALRHQITLRIEASALFPVLFSSQDRCIAPTKAYAFYSGYGCFSYAPLFWYEEARIMDKKTAYKLYDHFYTRPIRGSVLITTGTVVGVIFLLVGSCLYINEAYYRKRFRERVYVD